MRYISTLLLLTASFMLSCNSTETTKTTQQLKTDTAKKISAEEYSELPVIVLPTYDGKAEDTVLEPSEYPHTLSVNAGSFYNDIAAYGAAYQEWVAPKNWTGTGESAPDATVYVRIHPIGDTTATAPNIFFNEIPACQGCIYAEAAPYFPDAMKTYNDYFNDTHSNSIKIPEGITINRLSPNVVVYSLPDQHGLKVKGVAYYHAADENGQYDAYYLGARFMLPESQSKLVDFLIEKFIETRKLK